MILIDENKLTNGCIELIANCYGIEVVYTDDKQYKDEIENLCSQKFQDQEQENILKMFRVKGE